MTIQGKRGTVRSPHWPSVEHFVRHVLHPKCQICGNAQVQVHHIHPFEDCRDAGRPELELCIENLCSLSETEATRTVSAQPVPNCHLIAGHVGSFKSYCPDLAKWLVKWKGMSVEAIQASAEWRRIAAARPVEYHAMSAADQAAFRATLDHDLPKDKITVWDGHHWIRNGFVLQPEKAVVPDPFFPSTVHA
jgi:hypothetical protein